MITCRIILYKKILCSIFIIEISLFFFFPRETDKQNRKSKFKGASGIAGCNGSKGWWHPPSQKRPVPSIHPSIHTRTRTVTYISECCPLSTHHFELLQHRKNQEIGGKNSARHHQLLPLPALSMAKDKRLRLWLVLSVLILLVSQQSSLVDGRELRREARARTAAGETAGCGQEDASGSSSPSMFRSLAYKLASGPSKRGRGHWSHSPGMFHSIPPRSPFFGCVHCASVLCAPDLISVEHLNRILH